MSFDVVWGGPVTRRVNVKDSTYDFAGTFNEVNNNNVTVTWSGSNALGFRFTSDVGNLATSTALAPGNFFAQLAKERNGIFFPGGTAVAGADPAQPATSPKPPAPGTGALVATPAGSDQAAPPAAAPAGLATEPALHRARDQVFADLDGSGLAADLGPATAPGWGW